MSTLSSVHFVCWCGGVAVRRTHMRMHTWTTTSTNTGQKHHNDAVARALTARGRRPLHPPQICATGRIGSSASPPWPVQPVGWLDRIEWIGVSSNDVVTTNPSIMSHHHTGLPGHEHNHFLSPHLTLGWLAACAPPSRVQVALALPWNPCSCCVGWIDVVSRGVVASRGPLSPSKCFDLPPKNRRLKKF